MAATLRGVPPTPDLAPATFTAGLERRLIAERASLQRPAHAHAPLRVGRLPQLASALVVAAGLAVAAFLWTAGGRGTLPSAVPTAAAATETATPTETLAGVAQPDAAPAPGVHAPALATTAPQAPTP